MTKSKSNLKTEELLTLWRASDNSNHQPDKETIKKNHFTPGKWRNFVKLIEDLDLNEDGIKILLEEIRSGRVSI